MKERKWRTIRVEGVERKMKEAGNGEDRGKDRGKRKERERKEK